MRIALFFWICLAGTGLLSAGETARGGGTLRVVTWNLQWFPGKQPGAGKEAADAHIAELAAAVKAMEPDILVLQEVAGEEPLNAALAGTGLKVAVISRFKQQSTGLIDGQQIAICAKMDAVFVHAAPWENGWAGAPRGFAMAAFDCGGSRLHVYGLHLKSNLGDAQINTAKREDATGQLLAHIRKMEEGEGSANSRWIACGDFNTDVENAQVPSEQTFPALQKAGFFWAFDGIPLESRITCPAKGPYPAACFDHFFVRGLGRPVARSLIDQAGSDHLPVEIDIAILANDDRAASSR